MSRGRSSPVSIRLSPCCALGTGLPLYLVSLWVRWYCSAGKRSQGICPHHTASFWLTVTGPADGGRASGPDHKWR